MSATITSCFLFCAHDRLRLCRAMVLSGLLAGLLSPAAMADGLQWQRGAAGASEAEPNAALASPSDQFIGPATSGEVTHAAFIKPAPVRAKRPTTQRPTNQRPVASRIATTESSPSDFASAVEYALAKQPTAHGYSASQPVSRAQFVHHGPVCGCGDVGCGMEPTCEFVEPGCGYVEPDCGYVDPGCGCVGPTCSCGPEPCGCGDEACCGDCVTGYGGVIPLYIYLPPIEEIIVEAGVQGFKSPLDANPAARDAGNFGFRQGINAGGRMIWLPLPRLGYQLGYAATQNQLSGDSLGGQDAYSQQFLTTGLFYRAERGWQYGVVYDLLQDERQASTDFSQVRGLFSYTNRAGVEWGFEFSSNTNEELIGTRLYSAADQYRLFYRLQGRSGGDFKGFLGSSSDNHVILGGELYAPLDHRWSIRTGFTYFIPTDDGDRVIDEGGTALISKTSPGASANEEAWNIGINLVWHYGARGKRWYRSPWRPMFSVADNGSFVIDDAD